MPFLQEDPWINSQATNYDLSDLQNCSIGVCAKYYLDRLLDTPPYHEPLLSVLGGLTGIESHIVEDLSRWDKNQLVPFFIFDGLSQTGLDNVTLARRREANLRTDDAWALYSSSQAERAVAAFGANPGAFDFRDLFPLFQGILERRGLHFLVSPYNASAQLAYFEHIDSDECAGIMGPQELLLYPISDSVIRSFDWDTKTVTAISKKKVMRGLGVTEPMLVDAMLMAGTSFLPKFPPLMDGSTYPGISTVVDAVNILRTSDKSVAAACASFNDIVQAQDPDWLEKYRKAKMAVHHFIFIAEDGQVQVNDFDHLTKDHHEYLGLQLPEELFYYLSTGLIGARNLNCITHCQMVVQPTLDGIARQEYKRLIIDKVLPLREQALGLILPRVHRGLSHKEIVVRVWFDPEFSYTINHRALQPASSQRVGTWDVKEADLRTFFPADFAGPVSLEVLALANADFAARTLAKKVIKDIDSLEMVTSIAIWRFLHLRDYVNDEHKLTKWGNALATTLLVLKEMDEARPEAAQALSTLDEAALLAFELARLGLLNGRRLDKEEASPERKHDDGDTLSLTLISRTATLLKMKHQAFGYTGPLNRGLLAFRSLSSAVREADRDLLEAIVASMFLYGQCKRERDDYSHIGQRLPFSREPDIALGIAVRTFFDEDKVSDSKDTRTARLERFPKIYVPFAEALADEFRLCASFVRAINQGLQTLTSKEFPPADKAGWAKAQAYLDARPF